LCDTRSLGATEPTVTLCCTESQRVTLSHTVSRCVTPNCTESHRVVPSHTEPGTYGTTRHVKVPPLHNTARRLTLTPTLTPFSRYRRWQ
jgi:hypothetical protein